MRSALAYNDPELQRNRLLAQAIQARSSQPVDIAALEPRESPVVASSTDERPEIKFTEDELARRRKLAEILQANVGGDVPIQSYEAPPVNFAQNGPGLGPDTAPVPSGLAAPAQASAAPAPSSGDIPAHHRALLDTIASTESPDYRTVYGGSKFDDFSDHPRRYVTIKSGPNKGRKSSAAGRYQFLGRTWDQYADKLGLSDFSPANQDKAAIALAQDAYRRQTGGDLDAALQSGDPAAIARVGKALAGTWTSLPSGIEQGQGANRFVSSYNGALGSPAEPYPQTQNLGLRVGDTPPPVIQAGAPQQAPVGPSPQAQQAPSPIVQALQQRQMRPGSQIVQSPEERGSALAPQLQPQSTGPATGNRNIIANLLSRGPGSPAGAPPSVASNTGQYTGAGRSRVRGLIPRLLDQGRRTREGGDMVRNILNRPGNTYSPEQLNSQRPETLRQILLTQPETEADLEAERLKLENARLGNEKSTLEIEKLRNPGQYGQLTPEEEIAAGLNPDKAYQRGPDGKITEIGGADINLTNNINQGTDKFFEKLFGKTGEEWSKYPGQAVTAARNLQDFEVLGELLKVAPQGPLEGRLATMFPGFSSAGDAVESIVRRIAPTLRVEGSGSTSDIEYDGMLRGLPALRNQQGGNQIILEIMKSKAGLDMERGEIVNSLMAGALSRQDAIEKLQGLNKRSILTPDLKTALDAVQGVSGDGGGAVPEGVDPQVWTNIPEDDRSLWPGLSDRLRELLIKKYGAE